MPRVLICGDAVADARRLRDGGHEVILLGGGVSPDQAAAVAVQEDVALVAVTDTELGAEVASSLVEVVVFWITSASRASSAPDARD